MKKQITYKDIALYTNFSKTTISRYFNNPGSLTEENQAIIRQALADLNYSENKVAQILATGRTEMVGVIVPNLFLHYFSDMLNHILLTYREFGYKFLVFVGDDSAETEMQYIRELMSYRIEGLIVMSHTIPSKDLADLNIPIVSIEREDEFISSVNSDNYAGAIQASSLLHEHNCDVLIHVNSPTPDSMPAYRRILGFRDYCRDHKLLSEIILRDMGVTFDTIDPIAGELLEEFENRYPNQKKGIFFSDDTRANCFLNRLVRKYHTLPDSYKIVGFDNSPIAREAIYTISTVGQQIDTIAREAVHLLISQIDRHASGKSAHTYHPVHRIVTPVLYRRETTQLGHLSD